MVHADSKTVNGIYCRKCGYDLRGQAGAHRCPKCGREFDPSDQKTFLTPPRGAMWWVKRFLILLLALAIALAMCSGWFIWDWMNEPGTAID